MYLYIRNKLGPHRSHASSTIVRCVSSPVQTHAKSYHVLLRYLNNIRKLKSAQTISFRSTLERSFLDSFPFLLSNLIQVYAHQLEISCVSAPLLIDGRVVGNADINRRVVIRAYAPCLAWKTIFHAGDNSCRLVCLTLARSLALSLHPSPLPFPFLSSSHLGPTLSPRLSRFHPPFSPPLPRSRYTRGPKGGPRETSARYLIAVGPSHATPRHATNGRIIRATCPLPSSSPLVLRSSTCTKGRGGAKLESERPLV